MSALSDFQTGVRNNADRKIDLALTHIARIGGTAAVIPSIEGSLAGISRVLVRELGPEAAYEHLQRACDAIAQRVADERRAHGDQ